SLEELDYLLAIALGYATIKANKGNTTVLPDLLDFYKFGLSKGLFEDMNHHTFKNIVNVGLSNRALDWVEHFIEKYGNQMEEPYKTPMINMSKANLEFYRSNYKEALELIRTTKFDDIFHSINSKIIIIKSLYHLKEWEVLQSHIKAFEIFTRRHPKIGYKQELYLNFALMLQKIIKLNPYDETAKNQLLKQVQETEAINNRNWLLEMLK
ncbi:MAG: hypothetical protein AAF599_13575, partial [Bacteroidota bacterium]